MNAPALARFMDEAASRPAALGGFDCVRFVIEARLAGWGEDFSSRLHYACRRSAVEQLRGEGGLKAAFSRILGDPVAAERLVTGDIGYLVHPESNTAAVGLVMPGYVAVKVARTIARVPLTVCREGWAWDRH